jgi:putative transcriptional regulator
MDIGLINMKLFPIQNISNIEKGDLLISEPLLPDTNFKRTVILVVDDTEGNHLGFVINKIYEPSIIGDLIEEYEGINRVVFTGGPVQQEIIQIIHKNPYIADSILIKDGVFWGGDFEQIREEIALGTMNPEDCWFFLGYSGWYKGQLEIELQEHSWLVLKHDLEEVLSINYTDTWTKCIQLLGKEFELMTKFPIDPSLN